MFGRKKKAELPPFDEKTQRAVIRCSICTGEQVAGFRNRKTGKFEEVMLIRGEADLQRFCEQYHLKEVAKEY